MEMNVQKWVRLARGIGKGLLNGEGKQMDDEVSEWAKESDRGKRILEFNIKDALKLPGFISDGNIN